MGKTPISTFLCCVLAVIITSCNSSDKYSQIETASNTAHIRPKMDKQIAHLLSNLTIDEKLTLLGETSPAVPRLGLPAYNFWNEALHGVARAGRATVFPQPIGMAASFDENLIERVGTAVSDEARAKFNSRRKSGNITGHYTSLTFWTPNVNLFRDPRWGRGLETYGEDPYLMGLLGGAYVRGLQGNHPEFLKSAGCAKHYVVHSGPEEFRHSFNAEPNMIDFYNSYLPAFRKLVKKDKVEAVMTAYNRTFGIPCASSKFLIQDILRKKWDFKGHLVTDCGALDDFWEEEAHNVTNSKAEGAAQVIDAGVSIFCGSYDDDFVEMYEKKLITENQIDTVLKHAFRTRWKLGLLDSTTVSPWDNLTPDIVNAKDKITLAREAAQKSVVLLKNNGVLPLAKNLPRLFVTGPAASSVDALLGNYHGVSGNMVTILEGVTNKVKDDCMLAYRQGFHYDIPARNPINYAEGEAKESPTIVVFGMSTTIEGEEGEAISSTTFGDKTGIELPQNQIDFLKAIREENDQPIIAVIVGGSPIALGEVSEIVDAVIMAWYPGEQGGNAVADVIFGDINPSGRLPLTFPKSTDQLPDYADYSMQGRTYRYTTNDIEYPFGFGLSYTSFSYSNASINKETFEDNGLITLKFGITNNGARDGDEIVQVYVKYPEHIPYQPNYDLKAVKRISLKKGSTLNTSIDIPVERLKYYNEKGEAILAKGEYTLFVGGSQPDDTSIKLTNSSVLSVKTVVN